MADVRLIDVKEAYEAITELSGQADTKSAYAAFWKAGRVIRNLPTVDAAPVVHGQWIETPSFAPEYECSECGQSYEWWEVSEAHYCPNCGAKMDLEV